MTTTTIQRLIVDLAHLQCELEQGPHDDAVAWARELRLVTNAVNALVELRVALEVEELEEGPEEPVFPYGSFPGEI